jgi:hypothetical protein
LWGGSGGDVLIGGAGADVFQYFAIEDSQNILINGVLQQDQIIDFAQGEDKIDLSAIDANPLLAGDQAFVFVADPAHYTGDWTGVLTQITWADGTASICVSTDADPECELIIYMSNPYQFTANDFHSLAEPAFTPRPEKFRPPPNDGCATLPGSPKHAIRGCDNCVTWRAQEGWLWHSLV